MPHLSHSFGVGVQKLQYGAEHVFFMFFFTAGQLSPVCPISLKSVILVFDLSQHQWGSIPRDNLSDLEEYFFLEQVFQQTHRHPDFDTDF